MKAKIYGRIEGRIRLVKINHRPRKSIVVENEDGQRATVHEGQDIIVTGDINFSNRG